MKAATHLAPFVLVIALFAALAGLMFNAVADLQVSAGPDATVVLPGLQP